MSKLFYDHLIVIEEITVILDAHSLPPKEKQKLIAMIDETLHNHILDTIFTHLPKDHHEEFIQKLTKAPHDKNLIQFLNEKTGKDMEKEILKKANFVKGQIKKEIERSVNSMPE